MTAGPVLDGGRAFYGRPQLTDAENRVLSRIAEGAPLVAVCEHGGKAFYIGNAKVRTETAQRLINRRYVRPRDVGLFPDVELAQSYELTPHWAEKKPSLEEEKTCLRHHTKAGPSFTEKETKSCEEIETVRKKSTPHEAME